MSCSTLGKIGDNMACVCACFMQITPAMKKNAIKLRPFQKSPLPWLVFF